MTPGPKTQVRDFNLNFFASREKKMGGAKIIHQFVQTLLYNLSVLLLYFVGMYLVARRI